MGPKVIWKRACELEESETSFVTVTLTAVVGSAPQNVGSKIVVTQEGLDSGTVGGGKVEAACIKRFIFDFDGNG